MTTADTTQTILGHSRHLHDLLAGSLRTNLAKISAVYASQYRTVLTSASGEKPDGKYCTHMELQVHPLDNSENEAQIFIVQLAVSELK